MTGIVGVAGLTAGTTLAIGRDSTTAGLKAGAIGPLGYMVTGSGLSQLRAGPNPSTHG
jgi:hypothetical protein